MENNSCESEDNLWNIHDYIIMILFRVSLYDYDKNEILCEINLHTYDGINFNPW